MDQLLIAASRSLVTSFVLSTAVDYVTSVLWVPVSVSLLKCRLVTFICSFVVAGRSPVYSGPQHWDLM